LKIDSGANSRTKISLTLDPALVNAGFFANTLLPNLIVAGCICSVEDHGYLVNIGIGEVKAFLHRNELLPLGKNFRPGEVIIAVIKDYSSNVVHLTPFENATSSLCSPSKRDIVKIDSVMPGLLFSLFSDVCGLRALPIYFQGY
jgi:rRNA biogenesis protein RRP5